MRLAQAAFEVECTVQARGNAGRATQIEQVDCELADPRTALAYVYFCGDDQPLLLLIDLEAPTSDGKFESEQRDALLLALLNLAPASALH